MGRQTRNKTRDQRSRSPSPVPTYSSPLAKPVRNPSPVSRPALRVTDIIPRFDGSGDVVLWLEKLELACQVQGIKNEAALICLFLEGPAFDVYQQLSDLEKLEKKVVTAKLKEAFGLSPMQAFGKFKQRALQFGESPDVFLADLGRLLVLVGCDQSASTTDRLICCQFIDGLPEPARAQVKALSSEYISRKVLVIAKSVLSDANQFASGFAAVIPPKKPQLRCKGCNKIGHEQPDCRVECFKCHKRGHIQTRCTVSENC